LDSKYDIHILSRYTNEKIDYLGQQLPIYGDLLSFIGQGNPLIHVEKDSQPVAVQVAGSCGQLLRVGFDLFREVSFLLSQGQPIANAHIPTLDIHIAVLRKWIVDAGTPLVEIPPAPTGHAFFACLTHDVDFIEIRRHLLDRTMFGFLYRASIGSLHRLLQRKLTSRQLLKNWKACLSLPLIYLGYKKDFWFQFERYLEIEKGLPSTFFLIPFKNKAGEKSPSQNRKTRAARYDIGDIEELAKNLTEIGYEVAVHGIDAWHSCDRGRQELNRVSKTLGQCEVGIRMHWLYFDDLSPRILDQAGFCYDSTLGYNDVIGFRNGTMQVFRPVGAEHLLELPLHIQDTSLFYPRRMNLSEVRALRLCKEVLDQVANYQGVVTFLWHLRSLAPERLWDRFYLRLLEELKGRGARFGTAREIVKWFRRRRSVLFQNVSLHGNLLQLRLNYHDDPELQPGLTVRIHLPHRITGTQRTVEVPLKGEKYIVVSLDSLGEFNGENLHDCFHKLHD
jgi:hypothetical protein